MSVDAHYGRVVVQVKTEAGCVAVGCGDFVNDDVHVMDGVQRHVAECRVDRAESRHRRTSSPRSRSVSGGVRIDGHLVLSGQRSRNHSLGMARASASGLASASASGVGVGTVGVGVRAGVGVGVGVRGVRAGSASAYAN